MTKKTDFRLFVFFFSILFLPKIHGFDLKIIMILAYMLVPLLAYRKGRLTLDEIHFPLIAILVFLICLFLFNSLLHTDAYQMTLLRYLRCLLSLVAIYNYLRVRKPTVESFVNAVTAVLTVHAAVILLAIAFPQIRPYINLFSQYSKKFLRLRSSGLLSGFDFAGYYLNAGMLLRVLYNLRYRKRVLDGFCILFIMGTIFTSRINTLLLVGEIFLLTLYTVIKLKRGAFSGVLLTLPILFVGSVFSILTIEYFEPIKQALMNRFVWIAVLDRTINLTYADSRMVYTLGRHFYIAENINKFIGNGVYAYKDPGYTKTLYEAGFLGLAVKLFFYYYIFFHCFLRRKTSIFHIFVCLNVLLVTAMEFKLQFFFATGAFELLMACFTMCLLVERGSIDVRSKRERQAQGEPLPQS